MTTKRSSSASPGGTSSRIYLYVEDNSKEISSVAFVNTCRARVRVRSSVLWIILSYTKSKQHVAKKEVQRRLSHFRTRHTRSRKWGRKRNKNRVIFLKGESRIDFSPLFLTHRLGTKLILNCLQNQKFPTKQFSSAKISGLVGRTEDRRINLFWRYLQLPVCPSPRNNQPTFLLCNGSRYFLPGDKRGGRNY